MKKKHEIPRVLERIKKQQAANEITYFVEQNLLAAAHVKTGDFITRLLMGYVVFIGFCVFALFSPDKALFLPESSLNMPFFGKVPYLAFMITAPSVIIVMRIYLEVYIERWKELDRKLQSSFKPRTISSLKHPLLRFFSCLALYPLLPVTLSIFAWKASGLESGGNLLFTIATFCLIVQIARLIPQISKRYWIITISAFFFSGCLFTIDIFPHRRLDFVRMDMNGAFLKSKKLAGAKFNNANLTGAKLYLANMIEADLFDADLRAATIDGANLLGANLQFAKLGGASLVATKMERADLTRSNLVGAKLNLANLSGAILNSANLRDANLQYSKLVNADLSYSDLTGADLSGADLRGATLVDVNLSGTNLSLKLRTDPRRLGSFSQADKEKYLKRERLIIDDYESLLSQAQINQACQSQNAAPPILPERLSWHGRVCF